MKFMPVWRLHRSLRINEAKQKKKSDEKKREEEEGPSKCH